MIDVLHWKTDRPSDLCSAVTTVQLLGLLYTVIGRLTQPGHFFVARRNEYQQKLAYKQAHRAMH